MGARHTEQRSFASRVCQAGTCQGLWRQAGAGAGALRVASRQELCPVQHMRVPRRCLLACGARATLSPPRHEVGCITARQHGPSLYVCTGPCSHPPWVTHPLSSGHVAAVGDLHGTVIRWCHSHRGLFHWRGRRSQTGACIGTPPSAATWMNHSYCGHVATTRAYTCAYTIQLAMAMSIVPTLH